MVFRTEEKDGEIKEFVSWCFEPSQPLGVTSGLRQCKEMCPKHCNSARVKWTWLTHCSMSACNGLVIDSNGRGGRVKQTWLKHCLMSACNGLVIDSNGRGGRVKWMQ